MSRGRQYPLTPKFYTGCGWQKRMRDGVVLPCECVSCKVTKT